MQEIKSFSVPSTNKGVMQVEACLDWLFTEYKLDETLYGNMFVAVSEAIINARLHGNNNNPEKQIQVAFFKSKEELCVVVKDEGNGFEPTKIQDPTAPENLSKINGRGIFLMKNLSEKIEFNKSGSEVSLFFNLSSTISV